MPRNKNYLLSSMTSTKIGGSLKHVFFPRNIDELANNLRTVFKKNYSFYVLGGGTNTILGNQFDDNSSVLNLQKMNKIFLHKNATKKNKKPIIGTIETESGSNLQDVVNLGYSHRLAKFDYLNRIPGSIGGAIYGNAGAYGVEISELVEKITVINLKIFFELCNLAKNNNWITVTEILRNSLQEYNYEESKFSYRNSVFKDSKHEFLIVKIRLKSLKIVKKDLVLDLENSYHKIAQIRDLNYSKNLKSPGSTFKNIQLSDISTESSTLIDKNWIYKNKIPVAKLLNTCESVNQPINGIKMKDNHCNILTNQNPKNLSGTLEDVRTYLDKIKYQVEEKYGIRLEEEIRLIDKFHSISDTIIN